METRRQGCVDNHLAKGSRCRCMYPTRQMRQTYHYLRKAYAGKSVTSGVALVACWVFLAWIVDARNRNVRCGGS